jgi:threonine dehydratase
MRCVAAPAVAGLSRLSDAERAALDRVRHLGTRFPDARLREVPLVRAPELDALADPAGATRVWLALEALQVTGSVKVRGALVSVDAHRARGHVVAATANNHSIAVAYAAGVLDLLATVCVPRNAPPHVCAKIRTYGAEIVFSHSERDEDAAALGQSIALAYGATFVSPHDDVEIVRANGASLGFEIVRALGGVPERVLVPFDGGAVATGLALALAAESAGKGAHSVWGVQSEASCSMALALEAGRYVGRAAPLAPHGRGGARSLYGGLFSRAAASVGGIVVVSESEVGAAMEHAHNEMGLVIERRAAAALAPVLFGLPEAVRGGDLVVALTGRNVDSECADSVPRDAETDGL